MWLQPQENDEETLGIRNAEVDDKLSANYSCAFGTQLALRFKLGHPVVNY